MSKTAVIIPCYNEEKRLVPYQLEQLLNNAEDIQLYFVDDCSSDRTLALMQEIKLHFPNKVHILSLNERSGKAEAVRRGAITSLKNDEVSSIGFMDADFSVTANEFIRLSTLIKHTGCAFVTGSRIKKIGCRIVRNEWRHFYSRIIATLVGFITKIEVYDTQCGAKIFSRQLAGQVFAQPFKTKWLFDVELFYRMQQATGNLSSAGIEEPLNEWTEMHRSKLQWFHFFHILRELFILNKYCSPDK